LVGLKNLKYSYEYNKEYDCYISTIIEDFCEVQIWRITSYLENDDDYIEELYNETGGMEEIEKLELLADDIIIEPEIIKVAKKITFKDDVHPNIKNIVMLSNAKNAVPLHKNGSKKKK